MAPEVEGSNPFTHPIFLSNESFLKYFLTGTAMKSPEIIELLEAAKHRVKSGRIDDLPGHLKVLVSEALGKLETTATLMAGYFDPREGAYICDALHNADYPLERFCEWPKILLWDLEDVEKCEKLGSTRYGVDIVELQNKIERLTLEQALWLVVSVDRFWEDRMRRGESDDFFEVKL